jgi:hypothetical protein
MQSVYVLLITCGAPKLWAFKTSKEAREFRDQYLLSEYYEYNEEEYGGDDIVEEMKNYDYYSKIEELKIN